MAINTNGRALHVEEIAFEDGTTFKNRYVVFMGDFVLVSGADVEGNEKPSMFNVRTIKELYHVEDMKSIEAREKSKAWVLHGL